MNDFYTYHLLSYIVTSNFHRSYFNHLILQSVTCEQESLCPDLLENGLEDMGRGKGKLGRSERVAWTYIHYQR